MLGLGSAAMRRSFGQPEAKLLAGALSVGVIAPLVEGRFTPAAVGASAGLATVVALGIIAVRGQLTARLITVVAAIAVAALVSARFLG
jgi:hypothetical protein